MTMKTRARGLFTPKEFAAVDAMAFSPAALQAAFLLEHPACRDFYDRRSAEIRSAAGISQLRAAVEAARKEGALYDRIAATLLAQESIAKASARERESRRATEAPSRFPLQYERRTGRWVEPGFFAPVPYVDGPSGQDFTHPILG